MGSLCSSKSPCHESGSPHYRTRPNRGAGDERELSTKPPYRIDAGAEPVKLIFEADPR